MLRWSHGIRQGDSKQMKGKKGISTVVFVLLYYNFMYENDNDALIEEPDQWVMVDFKKWRSRGYSKSTAAYTTSLASNTTNTTSTTSNVTAPVIFTEVISMKLVQKVYPTKTLFQT